MAGWLGLDHKLPSRKASVWKVDASNTENAPLGANIAQGVDILWD
jgi:hypothetical protein